LGDHLPLRRSVGLRLSVTLQAVLGLAALLATAAGVAWAGYRLIDDVIVDLAAGTLDLIPWGHAALLSIAILIEIRLIAWLWAPLPAADGFRLARTDAVEFFALIDRSRRQFGVVGPLEVRIGGDMNVCVVQRFDGVVLHIGLPLLMSVSVEQWLAIMAHEFGHLDLHRRGFARSAGHVCAWWHRVLGRIDEDDSYAGRLAMSAMLRGDRRYLADSCRLCREEEFEADLWAAQRVGAQSVAAALRAIAIKNRNFEEHFLPGIFAQAEMMPAPVILPYQSMAPALESGFDYDSDWGGALNADDLTDDELSPHPSLQARLEKLGVNPQHLVEEAGPPLGATLGLAAAWLAADLDRAWWHHHADAWSVCHRQCQESIDHSAAGLDSAEEALGAGAVSSQYVLPLAA
jgi:hypothetical protein